MHRVAEELSRAEVAVGLDSHLVDPTKPETWLKRKSEPDGLKVVCGTLVPT